MSVHSRRLGMRSWRLAVLATVALALGVGIPAAPAEAKGKRASATSSVVVKRGKVSRYVRGFRFGLDLVGSRTGAGGRSVGAFKLTWKKRPFIEHEELNSDHLCLERFSHSHLLSAFNEVANRARPRLRVRVRPQAKKGKQIDEDTAIDIATARARNDGKPTASAAARLHASCYVVTFTEIDNPIAYEVMVGALTGKALVGHPVPRHNSR